MNTISQHPRTNLETTIVDLIKIETLNNPTRTAIVDGELRVSYAMLQDKANEVAGELISHNIAPKSLVAVCMNRSWELIATLIGVMQAGCAYVPLDPSYPKDRIAYMLSNAQTVATIVDTDETANLCNNSEMLIRTDALNAEKDTNIKTSKNELAYVIYTSGSTGKPKGVAVEHASVVAMIDCVHDIFEAEQFDGMLAAASVCFDTSVFEIFGTLCYGGKIILAKNALDLLQLPAVDEVKTCVMVPSSVQALLSVSDLPKSIACLIFGGEALKRSLVKQAFAQKSVSRVFNFYGPTEDTVFSTTTELFEDEEIVTIGTSVKNSSSYILDENLQLLPIGEAGELHLAGNKLARGYLYDEEKTKERFIEMVPTAAIPANRLYKTGDLCCRLPNGKIEFLGRVDQQVKIRGFRIELEEIEATLEAMEGIEAAAVSVIEGGIGQKILTAFVVIAKEMAINADDIKSYVSKRLPKYMVPQVIQYLEKLPLLPNDKLDRKKLSKLQKTSNSPSHAQASNGTETFQEQPKVSNKTSKNGVLEVVQSEFGKIVNIAASDHIKSNEAFESYGLDSLSSLEFSCRLSNALDVQLPASAILEHATPERLVKYIKEMTNGAEGQTDHKPPKILSDTLTKFQFDIQSSFPTFQAANAPSWSADDKSKLVTEVLQMVNDNRRNPYGKVLQTGSAATGIVGDVYNDEVQEAIIWSTNLYFGLNRDAKVIKEATAALEQFGTGMGISASASGMTNQHVSFEKEFADLVGKEDACLFPTGYTANVGTISGLLGKNDIVVIDQLCHASIVDGARLSGATMRTFKHNDASDLESVLQSVVSPYHTVLVVLESVYSMGEGTAPVAEIVRMAKKYNALTFVDEAHSFGFYGKNGAGICAEQNATENVDFLMTTLSKALGSIGGIIAASKEHIGLLKASSRAYIFQASISPADIAAALTSLRMLRENEALRAQLWDRTRYMRKRFEDAGYDLGTGDGPIITPHFGDKDRLYAIVQSLYKRGVQTLAVTYPIVEIGRGRLRFICSASHTREDIDKTLAALIAAEKEVDAALERIENSPKNTNISQSDLEVWSVTFVKYLQQFLAKNTFTTPNLQLAFTVSEAVTPIVILIQDGMLTQNTQLLRDIPYCLVICNDQTAVSNLENYDVQGLLHNISNGSCTLKGQVEPFIWFFSRMVSFQKNSQEFSNLKSKESEEAIA
ncbi:linear gramicidin synthase subunit B [Kordia sp. SMS9]|uniref:amino acid adenylation domain-containing protein n=1 Tax=Kordia sp. SMS9 TaxID=2282170 RepID=UPI000E0D4F98|nr:amino acid adenylation domain-containing protein [Kordia sp. SMS9]AXG70998.1 linear gramicidin synthase subunit B [Kordia sp. SMS9]